MPERDPPVRRLYRLGHRRPPASDGVEWEIEHYLAERTERLVEEGWSPEAARREAERRFGPVGKYRPRIERIERKRRMTMKVGSLYDTLRTGVAAAARTLRRSPGFAAAVVLTLALGLGANAAMFGIVDRLLLRPPDHVEEADRLRIVTMLQPRRSGGFSEQDALTFPDLGDFREANTFEAAGFTSWPRDVTIGSGPDARSADARLASWNFFRLLGVEPVRGRFFTEEEDRAGAAPTVVLAHDFWMRDFGGDPDIVGRAIEVAGHPVTVVGIAPRGFTGVTLEGVELWLPLDPGNELLTGNDYWRENRSWWWMNAVARLAPGSAEEAAMAEATALNRAGRAELIEEDRWSPESRIAMKSIMAAGETDEGKVAKWLMGVAALVLLIACANVANLLLARASRRRRESAVRLALGGSRARLASQHALEAVVLALLGGALALAVAHWGGGALAQVLLPNVLFTSMVTPRVVGFTLAVTLGAGLLAGVAPALQRSRGELSETLSEGSRGASGRRSRLRGGLAVLQAALSVVLLVGAGLFVSSLHQARSLDLGIDVDGISQVLLELDRPDLADAERTAIHERAAEVARRIPGVSRVTVTAVPFYHSYSQPLEVPGVDSVPRMPGGGPYFFGVDEAYFETVGLEIVEGRGFEPSDDAEGAERVAVVARTMADSLWDGSAVGQCLLVGSEAEACTTVVGVVEDASRGSLETDRYFAYYLPLRQSGRPARGLFLVADGEPAAVRADLARALRTFSPEVRFARVESLRSLIDPQLRSWTLGASMFTAFGLLALVVAAVGVYSLLAFDVAERTREIGIRTALGAGRDRVVAGVVLDGTRLIGLGLVLGLGVAWLTAPRIEELLFDVPARSPWVLAMVTLVLLSVAVVASLLPALRATRIDPVRALRTE